MPVPNRPMPPSVRLAAERLWNAREEAFHATLACTRCGRPNDPDPSVSIEDRYKRQAEASRAAEEAREVFRHVMEAALVADEPELLDPEGEVIAAYRRYVAAAVALVEAPYVPGENEVQPHPHEPLRVERVVARVGVWTAVEKGACAAERAAKDPFGLLGLRDTPPPIVIVQARKGTETP